VLRAHCWAIMSELYKIQTKSRGSDSNFFFSIKKLIQHSTNYDINDLHFEIIQ